MARVQFDPSVHEKDFSRRCPLCGSPGELFLLPARDMLVEGTCQVCGEINVTLGAADRAKRLEKGHFLSAMFRRRSADANEPVTESNVETVLKDAPAYSVQDKLDLALRTVASRTSHPGQLSTFQYTYDYPLLYAAAADEAMYYLKELHLMGHIELDGVVPKMRAKGYQRLADIEQTGKQSDKAFIAMWFDASVENLYDEGIKPAVIAAGYKPLRMKEHEHVNRIDDEIVSQIRRSRFMIADFSGQRGGVYFEAGLMIGLGRNVFWLCRKPELHKLHFDTRQYNFIDYETPTEAKKRLLARIVAIEGPGPH